MNETKETETHCIRTVTRCKYQWDCTHVW